MLHCQTPKGDFFNSSSLRPGPSSPAFILGGKPKSKKSHQLPPPFPMQKDFSVLRGVLSFLKNTHTLCPLSLQSQEMSEACLPPHDFLCFAVVFDYLPFSLSPSVGGRAERLSISVNKASPGSLNSICCSFT